MQHASSWGPPTYTIIVLFSIIVFLFAPMLSSAQIQNTDHLVINEVLYDPKGTDTNNEWIELYNPTTTAIHVEGWSIQSAGTTFSETFSWSSSEQHIIEPGTFYVIGESNVTQRNIEGTLNLQNGGSATDGIRIINAEQEIVDTILYDTPNTNILEDDISQNPTAFAVDVKEGSSLARITDGKDTNNAEYDFAESLSPTPGNPNIIEIVDEEEDIEELPLITSTPSPTSTISDTQTIQEGSSIKNPKKCSIEEAKKESNNTWVQVSGIVTASPNTISPEFFYIQDNKTGIKIYSSKKEFPELPLGAAVRIIGKKSESNSETKINIQTQENVVIEKQDSPKNPTELNTGDLQEHYEGLFVILQAVIERKHGTTLYLNDGSGEAKITFAKNTGILLPEIEAGETIRISGIVSENDDGYRILPRIQEDIQSKTSIEKIESLKNNEDTNIENSQLLKVGISIVPSMIIAIILTTITIIIYKVLRKKEEAL